MKKSGMIIAVLLAAGLSAASLPEKNCSAGKMNQSEKRSNLRYLEVVFDSVTVSKNVFFGEVINSTGDPEKLTLDIYSPSGDNQKKRPAVMWIHGGGFRPGNDKTQQYIVRLSQEFAKRGYICFSIDYRVRKAPKDDMAGTVNDAVSDAMLALNWIRDHSKKYGIDKNKLVVGGGSAGGITAVNFCCKDAAGREKWDKSGIIALVNLWGSPDPQRMFAKVDPGDPPTIIVHGTNDELVPYQNSVKLVKELELNKVRHELVTIDGAWHTPAAFMDQFVVNISKFLYGIMSGN